MTGRTIVAMREALESPSYFGTEELLGGDSWQAWRVVLIAAMGEALTPDEREAFKELTGREEEPGEQLEELWGVIGRRGGKSRAIACLITYLGCFVDYRHVLAPGQFGLIPVIAASREQATEIFNFAVGMIDSVECLRDLLDGQPTANTIVLKTRVQITIRTASFRHARGFTAVAVVLDEAAFFHSDASANPDREIVTAVRYALATTRGMLAVISSPYARRGEVWNAFRRHYGAEGDKLVLVVKASSKRMNPTLSDAFIARKYEEDPIAAAAELGGEFRSDVEGFLSEDVVTPCVMSGVFEIPPSTGARYVGFVDAASGSGGDSMTMGIAFHDKDKTVLACLVERKPRFNPEAVTEEFAGILKRYGVHEVTGDRWAKGFVESAFRRHSIKYIESEMSKSDLYMELAPMVTSGQVALLDNKKMVVQLATLERRPSRTGKDLIDHAPGGHDDVINAAAGAIVTAGKRGRRMIRFSPEAVAVFKNPVPGTDGWFKRHGTYGRY